MLYRIFDSTLVILYHGAFSSLNSLVSKRQRKKDFEPENVENAKYADNCGARSGKGGAGQNTCEGGVRDFLHLYTGNALACLAYLLAYWLLAFWKRGRRTNCDLVLEGK